jgi:hypothetical protein
MSVHKRLARTSGDTYPNNAAQAPHFFRGLDASPKDNLEKTVNVQLSGEKCPVTMVRMKNTVVP